MPTSTDRKATLKVVDMTEDMQRHALKVALEATALPNITEKEIASTIRKAFEDTYHGIWHCIVGRNFGSYVTHETKNFIYFTIGQVAILLFKSG